MITGADTDVALIVALGGPHARRLLADHPATDQRYWLRVWAARGLLWAWDDNGLDGVRMALRDPQWRVREMAAKVVARQLLGDLLPAVAKLRGDPVLRVHAAATRAVAMLTSAGA
ncbi:hypothetical protein [Plantactinospora soyae]|uniref:HEAT repeat domain-containing protein n=1 Tax=Plantactinospora soyae TaxID=1544732 RepID=A0A927MHB6_9ACTN|nr:hypothetical protein [Plantactinospora soyae]MBE1491155.1 hypothetical protein [Plantactinospora soyae]